MFTKSQTTKFDEINSLYGGNAKLTKLTQNGDGFRMELDSRKEEIPFSVLEEIMPVGIYQTLVKMDTATIQSRCTLDESIARRNFQSDTAEEPINLNLDGYEHKEMEKEDLGVVKRKRLGEEDSVCKDCEI